MNDGLKITLVGFSAAPGRDLLRALQETGAPIARLRIWDKDEEAVGQIHDFRGEPLTVGQIDPDMLSAGEIVILAQDADSSRTVARAALQARARVVDCTGTFAREPGVPLVLPGLNEHEISNATPLLAVPSPAAAMTARILAPLVPLMAIRGVCLGALQGWAQESLAGMESLMQQSVNLITAGEGGDTGLGFQAAFNVFPVLPGKHPGGPWSGDPPLRDELRRLLGRPDLTVVCGLTWVPIFHGLAGHLFIESDAPIDCRRADEALRAAAGIEFVEIAATGAASSQQSIEGSGLLVGRPAGGEEDEAPSVIALWFAADGLRAGVAQPVAAVIERLAQLAAAGDRP